MQEVKGSPKYSPNTTAIAIWAMANAVIFRASSFAGTGTSKNDSFATLFVASTIGCLIFAWYEFKKQNDERDTLISRIMGALAIVVGFFIAGLILSTLFFTFPEHE